MISSESLGLVRFALSIILIFLQKDVSEKSLLAHMHQNTPNNTSSCFPESKRVSCGCCTLATKYQADTVGLGSLVLSLALPLQTIGRPDNKTHSKGADYTCHLELKYVQQTSLLQPSYVSYHESCHTDTPSPKTHRYTHSKEKNNSVSQFFF